MAKNNEYRLRGLIEHLKTAIDGDRQILGKMWNDGVKGGKLFNKIENRMIRNESKLDDLYEQLCPSLK